MHAHMQENTGAHTFMSMLIEALKGAWTLYNYIRNWISFRSFCEIWMKCMYSRPHMSFNRVKSANNGTPHRALLPPWTILYPRQSASNLV